MKDVVVIAGEIKLESRIDGEAELNSTVDGEAMPILKVAASSDHNTLTNRDMDDQHPISAITGLQDALDAKVEEEELARVAFSGLIDDLSQENIVIIDCGTSTEVIDNAGAN